MTDKVFTWAARGGVVTVHCRGRLATTLRGDAAAAFLDLAGGGDAAAIQAELRRLSGVRKRSDMPAGGDAR